MSFTKLTYHIVFATKNRMQTITAEHERELYAMIHHIINKNGGYLHRINGMPDHVHILVDLPPTIAVATFIQAVKRESSAMMSNSVAKFPNWVGWQEGYGCFSYSAADIPKIKNYIINQKTHHKTISFVEEYRNWLIEMGVSPEAPYFPK